MVINRSLTTYPGVSESLIVDAHELVTDVFGLEQMDFAFIAGSIAKFTSKPTSDVDMVVGLKKSPTINELEDFRTGYFDLHAVHGLVPDEEYPGEVFGRDVLHEAIIHADQQYPTAVIDDIKIYDGIVWAGMLSAEKILLVPQNKFLEIAVKAGSRLVSKYHECIEHDCRRTEGQKGFDLCLKEVIEYRTV